MPRRHFKLGSRLALALAVVLPLVTLGAANFNAPGTGANHHQQQGVGCADCHGKGAKPAFVGADRCLSCHGPANALVAKTSKQRLNPHDSPHWGTKMECNVCHRQHEKTVNWCAHCHTVEATVP